jgi:hypothetical protein
MSRWSLVGLAGLVVLSTAVVAAEPIKLALSDFKMKADFEGGDALVTFQDDKLNFYTNGTGTVKLTVPADGEYTIVVEASGTTAEKVNPKFTLKVGDKAVKEDFELTTPDQKEYKFPAKLTKGDTTLSIKFTNDAYKENEFDRNLVVHAVRVDGK